MRRSQHLWRHRLQLATVAILLATLVLSGSRNLLASPTAAPILLVIDNQSTNPYGAYLGEILRVEGLNAFDTIQLTALTNEDLSHHSVVILAETTLTSNQATLFRTFVTNGGRLLAMRPDVQIASLFGLSTPAGTQTNGYLAINSSTSLGQSLPNAQLQLHGAATLYANTGATAIAALYTSSGTATGYPAIVTATTGAGQTAAFTYDLARNVVLTRQGNPANADVDTDGDGVLRTIDLFQTGGTNGGSWVDRNLIPIPQADVQQRLFARIVKELASTTLPLPQLWYFPGSVKAVIVPTGDAHANPLSYYQQEINSLNAHGGKSRFICQRAASLKRSLNKYSSGVPQATNSAFTPIGGNPITIHCR